MANFKNIEEAKTKKAECMKFLNELNVEEVNSASEANRIVRAEELLKSANIYILDYNKQQLDRMLGLI